MAILRIDWNRVKDVDSEKCLLGVGVRVVPVPNQGFTILWFLWKFLENSKFGIRTAEDLNLGFLAHWQIESRTASKSASFIQSIGTVSFSSDICSAIILASTAQSASILDFAGASFARSSIYPHNKYWFQPSLKQIFEELNRYHVMKKIAQEMTGWAIDERKEERAR